MPFDIGKLPRGLTGALALRNQGLTPQTLADQAVLTVESLEMFLLDTRVSTGVSDQAAPAVGANIFTQAILVPAGELWYVWHYTVAATLAAGEAIDLAPASNLDGVSITMPVGDYAAGTAGQNVRTYIRAPFWAAAGSTLGFLVRSVTLAPLVQGSALVTKLRV